MISSKLISSILKCVSFFSVSKEEIKPRNISGPRIRQARLKAGLDQIDLVAACDVEFGLTFTQSNISEIERQRREVKDFELKAMALILDVPLEWLLDNDPVT